MLNPSLDIFEDPINEVFQVRSKSEVIAVSFDNKTEQKIFETILEKTESKSITDLQHLIAYLKTEFPEGKVFKVIQNLKDFDILIEESVKKDFSSNLRNQLNFWIRKYGNREKSNTVQQKIVDSKIGIFGNGTLFEQLQEKCNYSGFEKVIAKEISANYRIDDIKSIIQNIDISIVDCDSWNPSFLEDFNQICIENKKPWIIIRGVNDTKLSIGPLFIPEETGCYNCLNTRLKSNMDFLPYFEEYENYLKNNRKMSKSEGAPMLIYDLAASICILELIKYVSSWDIPSIFNSFLTIDFYDYTMNKHPFLKLPTCPSCKSNVDFNLAPWIEPLILAQ